MEETADGSRGGWGDGVPSDCWRAWPLPCYRRAL